jgi:hypothetical protein
MDDMLHTAVCVTCILRAGGLAGRSPLPAAPGCPREAAAPVPVGRRSRGR